MLLMIYDPSYRGFDLKKCEGGKIFGPRTVHAVVVSALVTGMDHVLCYTALKEGAETTAPILPFSFRVLRDKYPDALEVCIKNSWIRFLLDEVFYVTCLIKDDMESFHKLPSDDIKRIAKNLDPEVFDVVRVWWTPRKQPMKEMVVCGATKNRCA